MSALLVLVGFVAGWLLSWLAIRQPFWPAPAAPRSPLRARFAHLRGDDFQHEFAKLTPAQKAELIGDGG